VFIREQKGDRCHNTSLGGPMTRWKAPNGFTVIEFCVVLMIGFTITGMAILSTTGLLPGMRANEAMRQTVAQLREGRETASAERRNVQVEFLNNNQIRLERLDVPTGTTILSTITLDHNCEFYLFGGVPDSPDAFGNNSAVDFGNASKLIFQTDGTLADSRGNPVSGSIFIGLPDHPETARVVTVLGATGRVRSYRWTGQQWIQ